MRSGIGRGELLRFIWYCNKIVEDIEFIFRICPKDRVFS